MAAKKATKKAAAKTSPARSTTFKAKRPSKAKTTRAKAPAKSAGNAATKATSKAATKATTKAASKTARKPAARRKGGSTTVPGISRIDQESTRTHGYFVRVGYHRTKEGSWRPKHRAFFGDAGHGGKEKAFKAAVKWLKDAQKK